MQPPASSDTALTAGAGPPGPPGPPTVQPVKAGLDAKIFFGAVAAGILVIGLITTVSVLRNQRGSGLAGDSSSPVFAAGTDGAGGPARHLIDFSLTERTGRPVNRSEFAGQILVVDFVFTGCSLSCLRVNDRMADLQGRLVNRPDVKLVSLTVDPASDTPAALTRFARQFGADSNRWLFLTGEKRVVYPVLEQSFLGPPRTDLPVGIPGGFGHTDGIALVDAGGTVRAMFNGLRTGVVDRIVATVDQLRNERGSP